MERSEEVNELLKSLGDLVQSGRHSGPCERNEFGYCPRHIETFEQRVLAARRLLSRYDFVETEVDRS